MAILVKFILISNNSFFTSIFSDLFNQRILEIAKPGQEEIGRPAHQAPPAQPTSPAQLANSGQKMYDERESDQFGKTKNQSKLISTDVNWKFCIYSSFFVQIRKIRISRHRRRNCRRHRNRR